MVQYATLHNNPNIGCNSVSMKMWWKFDVSDRKLASADICDQIPGKWCPSSSKENRPRQIMSLRSPSGDPEKMANFRNPLKQAEQTLRNDDPPQASRTDPERWQPSASVRVCSAFLREFWKASGTPSSKQNRSWEMATSRNSFQEGNTAGNRCSGVCIF